MAALMPTVPAGAAAAAVIPWLVDRRLRAIPSEGGAAMPHIATPAVFVRGPPPDRLGMVAALVEADRTAGNGAVATFAAAAGC